jgi:hypothetical protein
VGARIYIVHKSLVGVILEFFLGKSVDVLIEKKLNFRGDLNLLPT